jgi:hypothetical protein
MYKHAAQGHAPKQKFPFGQIVATPAALNTIPNEEIINALQRHGRGDWGKCFLCDWEENERSLKAGDRLHSVYYSTQNVEFWIMTEWDRSVTTVLLPKDY